MSGTLNYEEIRRKLMANASMTAKQYPNHIRADDPFLVILCNIVASTAARIHSDQTRLYEKLLDEFITGFGLRPRLARPAQLPLQFVPESGPTVVPEHTTVLANADAGIFTFRTDAPIRVSNANIAVAMVYQDEQLHLLPKRLWRSSNEAGVRDDLGTSCRLDWGKEAALLLALDDLPPESLSQLSLLIHTNKRDVRAALAGAFFRLAGGRQDFPPEGILNSSPGPAGIRLLDWFMHPAQSPDSECGQEEGPFPEGAFGGQVFSFPERPPRAKFSCFCPEGLLEAIRSREFQDYSQEILVSRVWIRVGLPGVQSRLWEAFERIALNVMTASNLELFDQLIEIGSDGTSIPLGDKKPGQWYAVSPQSVIGSTGQRYARGFAADSISALGTYVVRNSRIDIKPAVLPDGSSDSRVSVSLLVTDGTRANNIDERSFQNTVTLRDKSQLRVTAVARPAGGDNGEDASSARLRFASAILSRGRIITEADLKTATTAFDQRMSVRSISTCLERHNGSLRRTYRVLVEISGAVPGGDLEMEQLGTELQACLQTGAPLDVNISIVVQNMSTKNLVG